MKLKLILAAALLASGSAAFAGGDLGTLTTADSFNIGDQHLTGGFADSFTFVLTTAGVVTYGVSNQLDAMAITKFASVVTGTGGEAGFYAKVPPVFQAVGDQLDLGPGSYTLTFTGTGHNSAFGGTFNYVPAVPEPASVALLMAGLGFMGFVAKRRKQA